LRPQRGAHQGQKEWSHVREWRVARNPFTRTHDIMNA
jgi:hypothetical protein